MCRSMLQHNNPASSCCGVDSVGVEMSVGVTAGVILSCCELQSHTVNNDHVLAPNLCVKLSYLHNSRGSSLLLQTS